MKKKKFASSFEELAKKIASQGKTWHWWTVSPSTTTQPAARPAPASQSQEPSRS